jgi:hypothetical protein
MKRSLILWSGSLIPIFLGVLLVVGVMLGPVSSDIAIALSVLMVVIFTLFFWEGAYYHSWKKNMTRLYGRQFNEYDYNFLPFFRAKTKVPKGNILFKYRESLSLSHFAIYENGILAEFPYSANNPFFKEFVPYDNIFAITLGYIGVKHKYLGLGIESKDLKKSIIFLPFHLDKVVLPLLEKCFGRKWNTVYRENEKGNIYGEHHLLLEGEGIEFRQYMEPL